MSAPEFEFAIRLSGSAPNLQIVSDVVRRVLAQVGYAGDAADGLLDQLIAARAKAPADLPCEVQVRAHAGELLIAISQEGREWRTACPLPVR